MGACSSNCILISGGELICKSIVVHCCLESQRFSTAPSRRFLPLAHPVVREVSVKSRDLQFGLWFMLDLPWVRTGAVGRKKNSNVSMQNSFYLVYGQDVSQQWNWRRVSAKIVELSQISLDDTSWMADVWLFLKFCPSQKKSIFPSSQFSMCRTWLCVNQAV